MATAQETVETYADDVLSGRVVAGKWIYAAASRFRRDLERADLVMDWPAVEKAVAFFASLDLVGEDTGKAFELHPWQAFAVANLVGWRHADGARRFTLGILQVARGNGKTTLLAGLALWNLCGGNGRRIHVLANKLEQAMILIDTARTMAKRLAADGMEVRRDSIVRPEADSELSPLTARETSLDGLNPSLWIADEAAEYRGHILNKLITTGIKRRDTFGVVISTPGSNPETHYETLCEQARAVMSGEAQDDSLFAMLFGLDANDEIGDESAWPKANPGMAHGQPTASSLRRQWSAMKRDPIQRADFCRYHCARLNEDEGGWLDMSLFPGDETPDWKAIGRRQAWLGIDLSRTLDMSVVTVAVPLDDGRVAIRGHYWWPRANVLQRELDYRMPIRRWAEEGKITLTPSAEIDHEAICRRVIEIGEEFDVQIVGFDAWGAKYLAERLAGEGVPIQAYRMNNSTFAPGCQLWQNLWAGKRLVIGDDPILRRACAEAIAKRDMNGYVRPEKRREHCAIDPLVAAIMAVHVWGGRRASCYENEV
jgi:phage terminase large subunit-like protein